MEPQHTVQPSARSRVKSLGLLMLAILLGLASWWTAPYTDQFFALSGFLLGFLDPRRGMLWSLCLLLPNLVLAGVWYGPAIVESNFPAAFQFLYYLGVTYVLLGVNGFFGSCVGAFLHWVLPRLRHPGWPNTLRIPDGVLLAACVILAAALEFYLSLKFGGAVRTRWPWPVTLTALFGSVGLGLFIGQRVIAKRVARRQDPDPQMEDSDGYLELVAWGTLLGIFSVRRIIFESCFLLWQSDVTTCFRVADLPATTAIGLGLGLTLGIYLRIRGIEKRGGAPIWVVLSPWRKGSLISLGSFCALVSTFGYLGYRLWNV